MAVVKRLKKAVSRFYSELTEMIDLQILFTANQVAKIMGISRSEVYVLLNKGHLGRVHIGRSRRITIAQVDEFISDLTAA